MVSMFEIQSNIHLVQKQTPESFFGGPGIQGVMKI